VPPKRVVSDDKDVRAHARLPRVAAQRRVVGADLPRPAAGAQLRARRETERGHAAEAGGSRAGFLAAVDEARVRVPREGHGERLVWVHGDEHVACTRGTLRAARATARRATTLNHADEE
jgi:hypothetical protein